MPELFRNRQRLYSYSPVLTVTADAVPSITNAQFPPSLAGYGYSLTGYLGSDAVEDVITGALNGSTGYVRGGKPGAYAIDYANGTLVSSLGYGFTYESNPAGLTVTPASSPASVVLPTSVTEMLSHTPEGTPEIPSLYEAASLSSSNPEGEIWAFWPGYPSFMDTLSRSTNDISRN